MFFELWTMLKKTVLSFIEDEALSRGAAIAFYTVTSIAPVLLIVVAIAGLVFGREAAENAISAQLSGLMGQQTADVLQSAVASAADTSSGVWATLIGIATLIATASGVFGEMQSSLNAIWKTRPHGTTVSRLIQARAISLGLVAALGFLLIVSLALSAGFNFRCSGLQGAYHRTEAPSQDRRLLLANHALKSGVPVVTTHGGIFLNVFTDSSITSLEAPRLQRLLARKPRLIATLLVTSSSHFLSTKGRARWS